MHHFESELTIWNICAFGVLNPRLLSLAKQNSSKLKRDVPKVPDQAKAKWDGVINPKLQFQNATNQPKSIEELRLGPLGTHSSTSSDTRQVVQI